MAIHAQNGPGTAAPRQPSTPSGGRHASPTPDVGFVEVNRTLRGTIVQIVVPGNGMGSGFWVDKRLVATCWHVVKGNPSAIITVQSAIDSLFDLDKSNIISSNWQAFRARVVAKDDHNDIALLLVDGDPIANPPRPAIKINELELTAHYKAAAVENRLPQAGEPILLAGYPLGRPYAVVQPGDIASVAFDLPEFPSAVKILVSLVANPGNSGGPVFNRDGKVIGLLEGALPSRPGLDPAQAVSGIAVVVPSHFLSKLIGTVQHQ